MQDTPLRILQVMRAPVGGLFRHVTDLSRELAARGHHVGLVADSMVSDAQTDRKLSALRPHLDLGIHLLPIPRLLGPQDATTPFKLKALAQKLNVSILHGHGAKGGFAARLARSRKAGQRALYTPHGGALHFDPRSPSGAAFMAIERQLLGFTDALIFESTYAQSAFFTRIGPTKRTTRVVHNGLTESEFEPVAPDSNAADFVFIGELRMLKGIDVIIDALASLRRLDRSPATLVMAGDGQDRKALEERIAAAGLGDRVELVGVQPARKMFARGRCVLVPSRAESLPYVVMEAAAAGRPLIATDVGGIPEIFGPTAGRLVLPGSVSALQDAMKAYLTDPAPARADAALRHAFVRSRFSLTAMADSIEALYYELLSVDQPR